MMGYKDKIRRIELARTDDENPLVESLKKITKQKAWVNAAKTGTENQAGGDVKMREKKNPWTHSFEMQVTRTYTNFSYGKAKVTRFVGEDGGPCWVILGCLDEDKKSMFYILTGNVTLAEILKEDGPYVKLMDDKYYIIKPEAFIHTEKKWMGNSLDEVVAEWWKVVSAKPK